MNMEDDPTIFVLTRDFYDVRSSAGLLQATMEDIAKMETRMWQTLYYKPM